jgi:hypothetical protein
MSLKANNLCTSPRKSKIKRSRVMYAFFPLNWIFSDPIECEHDDVREKLKRVRVTVLKPLKSASLIAKEKNVKAMLKERNSEQIISERSDWGDPQG